MALQGDAVAGARRGVDREILALALPAFGALIAEPLFLIADSAMIGHLGAAPLAGLGVASVILQTIVGLMVFLAYGTTSQVARLLGASSRAAALGAGAQGLWLAAGLGAVLAIAGADTSPLLVGVFGVDAAAERPANEYLVISMLGLPAMLLVFAASGVLRGLLDTRTPLLVAGLGFGLNILLNALFIYGLGLGVAGSAIGTVVAQWAMVTAYLAVIVSHAKRTGASLAPRLGGMRAAAQIGGWLLLRTASLRLAMLAAVWAAARLGVAEVAAFQVTMTVFATLAFALDALAIAAQAIVGRDLGAGDAKRARAVLRRCLLWGVGGGTVLGAMLLALSPITGRLFVSDENVLMLLPWAIAIVALSAPLGGYVFVLDGVLIGAGDVRYLAYTGILNVAVFLPLAAAAIIWLPDGVLGLAGLQATFSFGYLGARAVTLGLRARGDAWSVTSVRK